MNFTKKEFLSKGSFSTIYKYYSFRSKEKEDIKIIKHIQYSKSTILSILELYILKHLSNNYVIKCQDILFDEYNNINIILPFADCDLNIFLKKHHKLNNNIKKDFLIQITKGINYLHSLNIIHCDIKPSNILIFKNKKNYILKITDFSLSKIITNTISNTENLYTKQYRPPECFQSKNIDYKADIWALGCTFYEILLNKKLFSENNNLDNIVLFNKNNYYLNYNCLNNNCFFILNYILKLNPLDRFTTTEILNNLTEESSNSIISDSNNTIQNFEDSYYLKLANSLFNKIKDKAENFIPSFKVCLIIIMKLFNKDISNIKISLEDVNEEIFILKLLDFYLLDLETSSSSVSLGRPSE